MAYYPDNIATTVTSQLGDVEHRSPRVQTHDARQMILTQSVEAGCVCKGDHPDMKIKADNSQTVSVVGHGKTSRATMSSRASHIASLHPRSDPTKFSAVRHMVFFTSQPPVIAEQETTYRRTEVRLPTLELILSRPRKTTTHEAALFLASILRVCAVSMYQAQVHRWSIIARDTSVRAS